MKTTKPMKFLFLSVLLIIINACSMPKHIKTSKTIEPLVSAKWLNAHLNDSDLVILDTSVIVKMDANGGFSQTSGHKQFLVSHIPTAGFADLTGNLSAESDLDFIMPSAKQFQKAMGDLGVGKDTRVVLYSVNEQAWPTRLWWMLHWAGFDQVAVLDGGFKAWTKAGYATSTEQTKHAKKAFPLHLRPEVIANQNEVSQAIKNENITLVDVLPEAHYLGKFSMYPRAGHIPTALNFPTSNLLDAEGLNKPTDEIEMLFEGHKENRTITYCGGGVAASNMAFTLYRLGYKDVAVYMGSLQEWTADPDNPMVTDAQ